MITSDGADDEIFYEYQNTHGFQEGWDGGFLEVNLDSLVHIACINHETMK